MKGALMLFDSTRSLLQSIVLTLERTGDESRWDDQTESGNACLFEMHQMSGRLYKAYKTDPHGTRADTQGSLIEKLNRALPHVRLMTIAIRRRDRVMALKNGKAGLAEMNDASLYSPSASFVKPEGESHHTVVVLPRKGDPGVAAGARDRKAPRKIRSAAG
jgi:hypothetical protein